MNNPKLYPLTNADIFEAATCADCPEHDKSPAIGAMLDDPDETYLCRRPLCKEHADARGATAR